LQPPYKSVAPQNSQPLAGAAGSAATGTSGAVATGSAISTTGSSAAWQRGAAWRLLAVRWLTPTAAGSRSAIAVAKSSTKIMARKAKNSFS